MWRTVEKRGSLPRRSPMVPHASPLDLPACSRGARVVSDLSLCSREPCRKASMATGAASSRGSMASAKRFMNSSYWGKA